MFILDYHRAQKPFSGRASSIFVHSVCTINKKRSVVHAIERRKSVGGGGGVKVELRSPNTGVLFFFATL